jgi:WD40 repeat protein
MTLSISEPHAMQASASSLAHEVFVVHTDAPGDLAFVDGYLLANLGLAPERVFRLQDLELGQPIPEEIERGVRSSRVTIVVLSAAYMDDRWVAFGQQLAAYASLADDAHGVLLPLLLEDCELTMHVASLVKLDFRNSAREAWDREMVRLRAYLERPVLPAPHLPCPYPGMRPFTRDDDARFCGRGPTLKEILYRLRHGERELYVIGPSGSGKSSLLAAGLVPQLACGVEGLPRFLERTIRPGEYPLERLAAVLDGDITAPAAVIHQLLARNAPATALLLVIDQLEELFTTSRDDQRRGFFALVRALRADPRCVLVFALRGDFYYGAFMNSPLWTDNEGRISRIDLGPLDRDSLQEVIERPARDLGVYLHPELVSQLLDDADREPGSLPLLQETLCQLWNERRDRLLTLADYRSLGNGVRTGLAFAVERHADFVLGRLAPRQKTIAFRILLRLVSFGEGRADTRRQQSREALRSSGEVAADFDAVLQCLVDQRLVTVTGDDPCGDVRVDLAHEVLIQAWSAFAERSEILRAQEQVRRSLETAAMAWRASGAGDDGLLGANRLTAAVAWRGESLDELGQTADLAAFLAASEVALASAQRRESEQREERNGLLMESSQVYQEIGRQRLIDAQRPLEAIPYLVVSRQAAEASGGTPSPSLRMLFAEATRNLPISPPLRHAHRVTSAAFSHDGARIVTASDDGTARVWDTATGTPISPPLEHLDRVVSAAFSPDGTRVITASGDSTARIWDTATGKPLSLPLKHRHGVTTAAFSPDGTRVVTASQDGTACVWDTATGNPISPLLRHQDHVLSAAFSPDGARVVTASDDKTARVWDAATGRPLSPPLQHQDRVVSAAFRSDGSQLATASADRTARLWDAVTSKPVSPSLEHRDLVWKATFSADGAHVITASGDGTARIWDTAQGSARSSPLLHEGDVVSAAFSPDGSRVVTASWDHAARIWDAITGEPLSLPLQHHGRVNSAAFGPDGSCIVTASDDKTARVWTVGQPLSVVLQHRDFVVSAAFSADGTRIVTASEDGTARVWDAATAIPLPLALQHQGRVACAAFSADGARVVTASDDGMARIWDAATATVLSPPLQHSDRVTSAAFSFDGTRVVTASYDGTARIWDAATGRALSSPLQHHDRVNSVAFSSDGTRIATASSDKTARIWDATTRTPMPLSLPHQDGVVSAVFSPDGSRVVTASCDGTARVWDTATGKPLSLPLQHQAGVVSAMFSSDGSRVVTASCDRTARVWDAATGRPLSPPLKHQASVASAAFSPDGTRIVTASSNHAARVWDVASGKPLTPPLRHRGVNSAAFSPDGMRVITTGDDSAARIWALPLSSGTLADWRATMEHASPYVLAHGVLSPRTG